MKANFGPMGLPMNEEAFKPKTIVNEYDPAKCIVTGTYAGHDDNCDCAVCDDIRMRKVLNPGVKHDQGKPDYTLLPLKTLEGVVRVMEFGVKKYARDDWKRLPDGYNRYLAAHLRHMAEVLEDPKHIDYESGLLSYDHALCDLIFARRFLNEAE